MKKTTVLAALSVLITAWSSAGAVDLHEMSAAPLQLSVPGGSFQSVLPPAPGIKRASVTPFRIDHVPVTNADFARFVGQHPTWRRDRVARVFADEQYLSHWKTASEPDAQHVKQPVVRVSWFAANAYCEARGARLPTWYEWEFVSAASGSVPDARSDDAWRQNILSWYSKSGRGALPAVGSTAPNYYGVRDLHGVVWEWVDDLSAMLVSGDNRQQSEPNALAYCGPGALTMEQKENYATLMRIAMLSSMQAHYTSATMGFRCAADLRSPQ